MLLLGSALPVNAQEETNNSLRVSAPMLGRFPEVSLYLEAYDASGAFITDLKPDQVDVYEDDQPRTVELLGRIEPGVQFTVAISAGPMMANVVKGITSYDQIQSALVTWAQTQPADSPDIFSLAVNSGLLESHLSSPKKWAEALHEYRPDLMSEQVSLEPFSLALDQASDATPNSLMKHAILYITAPPSAAMRTALPNLTSQAVQLGVPVFVWLVAPTSYASAPVAEPLIELANSSGGQFFNFSGVEDLPNFENYLQPLRYRYQVNYHSAIIRSGTHSLSLEVRHPQLEATSSAQSFTLALQPPRPIFLAPPITVERRWSEPVGLRYASQLEPSTTSIQMQIEFPDGYERPLKSSRLYVDGTLVTENTQAPFDRLEWDLSGYTESGQHQLQLEVEDQLGLKQSSIMIPVQVQVEIKTVSFWDVLFSRRTVLLVLGVVLAVILALVLLWRRVGRRWLSPIEARKRKQRLNDPVTQPVAIRQEKQFARSAGRVVATAPPPLPGAGEAPARLVPVNENGEPRPGACIALERAVMTFGSDPRQATCVLDSPTVSALHARLTHTAEGEFILADAGSVAGTWVNYTPASSVGVRLMHGDLIHIGRVTLRFELKTKGETRKITVIPYDEEDL